MKKAITIGLPIFWIVALMVLDVHAQTGGGRIEPGELRLVAKMLEAEGKPDWVDVSMGELLGLANKEPIPAKGLDSLVNHTEKSVVTFSYDGNIWVLLTNLSLNDAPSEVYVTQTDGVLRRAIRVKGEKWTAVPVSEVVERFAAAKVFWKEYAAKNGYKTPRQLSAPLDKELSALLDRYQLDSPIIIRPGTEWYMTVIVEKFLKEMLTTLVLRKPKVFEGMMFPVIKLSYERSKLEVGVSALILEISTDEEAQEYLQQLDDLVRHVFPQPKVLIDFGFTWSGKSGQTVNSKDLKAELLNGSQVNYQRVWEVIINAAETVPGVRLDPSTEAFKGEKHIIKTIGRKLDVNDPGHIVYEVATITLEKGSADSVYIWAISQICRRRNSAPRCDWIDVAGYVDKTGNYGVETPIIKAIVKAITTRK